MYFPNVLSTVFVVSSYNTKRHKTIPPQPHTRDVTKKKKKVNW